MSFTVQSRRYAYDNISAGNAAGQEKNQSQFFPYTPGTDPGYPDRTGQPGATNALSVNLEIAGNGANAAWGYGFEIP